MSKLYPTCYEDTHQIHPLGEPSSNLSCGSKVGFQESVDILLKHTKKIPENQAEVQPLLSLIQEKNVNLVLQRKGLPINGDVCK